MLRIDNLEVLFKGEGADVKAVDDITLSLEKGDSLGLVGESGSGKSVTALSVMNLLPPNARITSGKILFRGVDLLKSEKKALRNLRGGGISMIFQEPLTSLNPVMRCGEQVAESIRIHQNLNSKKAAQKVLSLFEKVMLPRPEAIYRSYPHQVSGGQKQRVMIAMAIANNPDLLIADEPTTALDVTVQKEIIQLLKMLKKEYGMTLLFISHDLAVVSEVTDRVAVMYKGRIVESGEIENVYRNPQHPYTRALLACRPPLTGKPERLPVVDEFLKGEVFIDKPVKKAKKTFEAGTKKPKAKNKRQPLLQVEDLVKKYPLKKSLLGKTKKYLKALDRVSLKVFPGETLGVVGESGSGKTTLGRAILRLIEPDEGRIFFDKKNLLQLSPSKLKNERRHMGIVFQDPYSSLNPRMSIGRAIMEPMKVFHLYGNNRERMEKTIGLLEKVGLKPEHFNRYPHEFSGGQRQRIVIARALALQPEFIICDEAVSALDVSVQALVLNLLNQLKQEFGFTYIFISHDLSVVRYMSDRIVVMKDGKIVETGDADEIYYDPKSAYTKQLIESIPKIID
ncbi:MAG: ABC transporter ATP-binding protein [Chlorobi bacterium]|nr:ABC transporter ATP-binding protein [Chlorobiota bacterium]